MRLSVELCNPLTFRIADWLDAQRHLPRLAKASRRSRLVALCPPGTPRKRHTAEMDAQEDDGLYEEEDTIIDINKTLRVVREGSRGNAIGWSKCGADGRG